MTRCDDDELNELVTRVNEFWRLRASDESMSDTALQNRLAETADGIAADLESNAAFYRTRAEFLRAKVT